MHKLLKKSLNTVQDFVANPKVHQVSQLVNGAIKIASTIAQAKIGGPVAVASGVIAGIDVLQDTFGIEKPDPCKVFKDANDLIGYASSIPKIASELKLERFIKIESFAKNADFVMVGFKIDDKYACWQKPIKGTETAPATIIYTSSGFELSAISKAVNQALGHPVVIASLHTINGTGRIKLDALPYSDTKYLGVNDPASFSEEVEKFHQKGISRAALLWGLPGSGKTSYLKNYAKIADKTLFLIPPELINDHNARGELTSLIDLIRPDILVLDDLDWVSDTVLPVVIAKIDEWRQRFPKTVLVATCNQIENNIAPLLRPGRLGKTLHFSAPSVADKREVLAYYLDKYGVDKQTIDVNALVSEMKHPCFTQDYVRFVAEEAVVLNQKQLTESIKRLNLHLKMTQGTAGGSDGYEEYEPGAVAEPVDPLQTNNTTEHELADTLKASITVAMSDGSNFHISDWTLSQIEIWATNTYLSEQIDKVTFDLINRHIDAILKNELDRQMR